MRIICKELKGDEIVLDVAEDTKIADVKKEIEAKLGVPGEQRVAQPSPKLSNFQF